MAVPNNILQTVQTYQLAELAFLMNSFAGINLANKKFKDFNELTANLGDTVTFDLAPRYLSYNGLVITQQPSQQRVQPLVCSQAVNVAAAYTDQQFIFQAREYMDRFGMGATKQLGTTVEQDILKNVVSGVRVNDPQNKGFGNLQTQSGPFRFYGDGVTPINSYGQLAQALANFRAFGASNVKVRGLLPVDVIPGIVNTGLQQFAMTRNNDIANSWELGRFSECDWYESNLLPTHIAGTIGDSTFPNNIITITSTNDPTGTNVTQITGTEPTGSTVLGALKAGDLLQFKDGVAGKPNMRFLTFIGQVESSQPVQFRATSDAATVGGVVTVTLTTATNIGLVSNNSSPNVNLNNAIQAGMQVQVLPSHRAGLIWSGEQFYLAMPKLPDEEPYSTVSMVDKDSGASVRHYWGSQFGQNVRAYVRDCIWGSVLVPENCMRVIFPLTLI